MLLGYCRVSSDSQRENTSISEQERKINGYAMMVGQKDFNTAIFYDEAVSGSTDFATRSGGTKLMAQAKAGDTIVATKLDRMFRSARNALNVIEELREKKIKLVLLDLGNDPVTDNGVSKFFLTILSGMAELERVLINERTAAGKEAKRAAGGHVQGKPPFGWRIQGSRRHSRLVKNGEEQKVLAAAHDLQAAGGGYSAIARRLSEMGYRNRNGGKFQFIQVKRMLEANG